MRSHPRTRWLAVAATLLVSALLWVGLLQRQAWLTAPHEFDGLTWELAAFPGKWLRALGAPLRADPPADEAIRRYFEVRATGDAEAARLEGAVEAAIDGKLDAALQDLGFAAFLGKSVWPPVNTELSPVPRMVATSPRDRIRLERAVPLRSEQGGPPAEELERQVEAERPGLVAIVVPLGGLSTYPAIVTDGASYASSVQVAAHEWVHHYFAFSALGWRTLASREALTINETAADIAAAEISARVLARFGDPTRPGVVSPSPAPEAARLRRERDDALRDLRLEVDGLLEAGRVEDAERRMEEARLDLEARGFPIRRINQAYFAWYGTYAARADSVDPIGAQLRELRRSAGSLPRFLDAVGSATSRDDIARLIERARATGG